MYYGLAAKGTQEAVEALMSVEGIHEGEVKLLSPAMQDGSIFGLFSSKNVALHVPALLPRHHVHASTYQK